MDTSVWLKKFLDGKHDKCVLGGLKAIVKHWDLYWKVHQKATWMRILFPCMLDVEQKEKPETHEYRIIKPEGKVKVREFIYGSVTKYHLIYSDGKEEFKTERNVCGLLLCNRNKELRLCWCLQEGAPFIRVGENLEILDCDPLIEKMLKRG